MPEDDANVTPLRSVDQGADGPEAVPPEEEIAGPGWTGRAVYADGAPPRVASSDAPPTETLPSPAAAAARDDLDEAAAELDRRVHGGEVETEGMDPPRRTAALEVADPVESPPPESGEPTVVAGTVAHEAPSPTADPRPVGVFDADGPDHKGPPAARADAWRETARQYAVNADYWRGRAEAAERQADIQSASVAGLQTRITMAEGVAEAAEALAGTVRPLVPRLPVRQREPIYQAHGRALEALAEYRKAGQ